MSEKAIYRSMCTLGRRRRSAGCEILIGDDIIVPGNMVLVIYSDQGTSREMAYQRVVFDYSADFNESDFFRRDPSPNQGQLHTR